MLTIPFNNALDSFSEQIDLDGQTYVFTFSWNNRESAWYLNITTLEEEQIVEGIKLVLGMEILQRTARAGIPPGELYCMALVDQATIARADMGTIVDLIYVTAAEVAST